MILADRTVSIIIPVYNAREYITQAVQSALNQPETGEVLIIEDGSPDDGLVVCEHLTRAYDNVRLLRHPDGDNLGAAVSRNLGIANACCPFIAFLDADDYFLPSRFAQTNKVFREHEDADGVYEAIGTHFQDQESKELFRESNLPNMTTVTREDIPPEKLFIEFMRGGIKHFSFNGFTAKSHLLHQQNFNERLRIFEDTDLMFKLSGIAKLYPGNISTPVAMRRVHSENRITSHIIDKRKTYSSLDELWELLMEWGVKELTGEKLKWLIRRRFSQLRQIDTVSDLTFSEIIASRRKMLHLFVGFPWTLHDSYCLRRFLPSRSLIENYKNRLRHNDH